MSGTTHDAQGEVPPSAAEPTDAPPRERKSRRGLFLGGGAAAVVVTYLVIAALASAFPFTQPSPMPTPAQQPTATGSPAALPAGLKPLKVLLPTDVQDANSECIEQPAIPWTNPGLVNALECNVPDMPDGQIFGYQMDSVADYDQAWATYNTWANFGTSHTETCPPGPGQSQGGPGEWRSPRFARRAGQVLECFTSDSGPVYVWTYPTENAFFVAQPPKSWTFSKLRAWWVAYSV